MAPIVEAEECGLLVPYGDVPALRAALQRLRDDVALRERLGRNGAEAFRRQYNWDAMEKRLLRLYEDLCPGGASPGTSPDTRDRGSVTAYHTGHRGETGE